MKYILFYLLLIVVFRGILGGHQIYGDGREYIIQTQAIVFDGSLAVSPESRRNYWNATNPYGIKLGNTALPVPEKNLNERSQAGGGFGGLYPDKLGGYRYYHYWAYSAVVAPLYFIMHHLDSSGNLEYFSFRLVNLCFLLLFFWLAFRINSSWPSLAVISLFLFSPLIPYCDWQHPEIFCLSLVFTSFYLIECGKGVYFAPLLLGLAASMNPPIALFFPCHLFLSYRSLRSQGHLKITTMIMSSGGYLVATLLALSSSLYFYYYFSTPNVIQKVGLASIGFASFSRVADIFFNPFIGAVFFFPSVFFLVPACIRKDNILVILFLVLSVTLAAFLATSTSNLNAGQIGSVRYSVWLIAPLWYLLFRYLPGNFAFTARSLLLAAGFGATLLIIFWFKTYELFDKKIHRFAESTRTGVEVAGLVRCFPFLGDVEIATENIMGKELVHVSQFNVIYVWYLGKDQYLWIFPWRALKKDLPIIFSTDDPEKIQFETARAPGVRWTANGNTVSVQFNNASSYLESHPVYQRYLMLRSKGKINKILKNQPIFIKNGAIEQVATLKELSGR